MPTPDEKRKLLETLEAIRDRKHFRKLDFFSPYEKQLRFINMGATKRERMLMAANQVGKSYVGAAETAYHLTGEYPTWWQGRKFDHPVKAWAAGETSTVTRDVSQKLLCGPPGVDSEFGSGLIPRDLYHDKPSMARGVTDAFDTIQIKHKTNGVEDGVSVLSFKSYEQGRTKFQGATLDFVWFDEEPDEKIYAEGLTRITATKGMVYLTFTPLKGKSSVVLKFINEPSPDRDYVGMVIDEALHIPATERATIIAGYPPHEREARALGIPFMGSGRVFNSTEESISEPAISDIPIWWFKLWGFDFGIDHPFAAVLIAWDKDADIIHVTHCIRFSDGLPLNHAAAVKPIGASVPVAWPQDGTQRDPSSGEVFATLYKKHGLLMLPEHATHPEGGLSTEAGILEMDERMKTGRLKVANNLGNWFEEYREYHRKDGQLVKVRDDLMSATRVALMMKRYAKTGAIGSHYRKTTNRELNTDRAIEQRVDFPLF